MVPLLAQVGDHYETKILLGEETVNKGTHETRLSKDGRFSDYACNQLRP
jgi:hypothetical protein